MGACTNTVGKSPSKNQSNIIRIDGELRTQQKNFTMSNVEENSGETINSVSFTGKIDHNQHPEKKCCFVQQNAQNQKKSEYSDINMMKNVRNQFKEEIDEADISNNPEAIQTKPFMNQDRNHDITLLYDPHSPLPVVFELSIEHAESGLVKPSKSYIRYSPTRNETGRCNWESSRENGVFRKRDENIKNYV